MGRELRRKQAKKEGKSLAIEEVKNENQIKKLIKIVCLLVFIVVMIYLISALFITKELNWFNNSKENTSETKANNSILAKQIFRQSEEEYYVYFYDFNNPDSEINSLISSKLSESKVYKVDTSDAFNSNYVVKNETDATNHSVTSLDDLMVVNPTLIKISGDVVVEYYEKAEINSYLES